MTRDKIDILWHQAMNQAVTDGEMFTRYHFAKLVAAAEREACARLVGAKIQETQIYSNPSHLVQVAAAIRARSGE